MLDEGESSCKEYTMISTTPEIIYKSKHFWSSYFFIQTGLLTKRTSLLSHSGVMKKCTDPKNLLFLCTLCKVP